MNYVFCGIIGEHKPKSVFDVAMMLAAKTHKFRQARS